MLFCVFSFFLFLTAYLKPKSKVISFLVLGTMWVLYGFNTYSGDFVAYEYVYNDLWNIGVMHFEPAYSLIMILCKLLNMSFIMFKVVLATLYVLLLYQVTCKYTQYCALALALYFLYPFPYFMSVLRGGFASLIIVNAAHHLCSQEKAGNIKFIFGILAATMFHYTSIFFFFLLFVKNGLDKKKITVLLLGIMLFGTLYMKADLYAIVSRFTEREKTLQWFQRTNIAYSNIKGIICAWIVLFGNIFISWLIKKYHNRYKNSCRERELKLSALNLNSMLFMLVLLLFTFFQNVAMRFVWELLPLIIFSGSNAIRLYEKSRPGKKKSFIFIIGLIIMIWMPVLLVYANEPYFFTEISAFRLFENNLLYQMMI